MTATESPARLLHSIEEAQAILGGLGRTTIYSLANQGEIVFVKIGRRSFVTSESLARYVERLTEGGDHD